MRALIVATNTTPSGVRREIASGKHQRIDYMELAQHLNTIYVDYSLVRGKTAVRWFEEKARMDFRLAQQVSVLAQEQNFDTVISLSERVGLPLIPLLSRDVRHVVIMHHPMSPHKLRLMQLFNVGSRWNQIITISQAEADGLKQALGLSNGQVVSLLTPVDTDFFRPLDEPVPLEQQDHIQSLGLSHRDYPTLLRAMRTLPHITCHLRVGSTWVNHEAGHEHEEMPHNVEAKPYVHPRLLRQCYAESRFIVVPIRDDTQWSAGCTSVQIAQAMGRAVIASDRPGLASYLIDGETGILVRTGDAQDMAEAVDYLWRNPAVAEKMGQRGREWIEANYSMDCWLQNMTRILENVAVSQIN
jgi:glycosyltransferase involved in cell wall biosynthesis